MGHTPSGFSDVIYQLEYAPEKMMRGNVMGFSELLEVIMIVCFGASWPMNVIKSYKSRTAKGRSLAFLLLIFFGYVAGIISKLINCDYMADFDTKWYVLFFYVLNLIMVGADLVLYFRNRKIDRQAENL